jgi:hypothetical protein
MTDEQTEARIAGILVEREHYVNYYMADRVKACDDELARLGYKPGGEGDAPAKRAQDRGPRTASKRAQSRKA